MKSFKIAFLAFATWAGSLAANAQPMTEPVKEAMKLVTTEQYSKARNILTTLVRTQNNATNRFYLGRFYLEIEQPDSAQAVFQEGLKIDPTSALCNVGLGAVQMYKGQAKAAEPFFVEAVKLSKQKSAEVFFRIGEAFTIFPTNNAEQAIRFLEAAAKLDLKNAAIYLMIGDAYLLKNDGSNASVYYEQKAKFYEPKNPACYYKLGVLMERARNYTEAVNLYKKGLDYDPNYAMLYKELGEVYYMANFIGPAVENYRKYLNLVDNNPRALYLYSGFLVKAKRYQNALDTLNMVDAYITSPQKHRVKAYCQYELKDCKSALESINKFMASFDTTKLTIEDYEYQANIEICAGGDTAKAASSLVKVAIKDSTKKMAIYRRLGNLYFLDKKYGPALPFFNWVITQPTSNNKDFYDLGRCLYFYKDYNQADTVFGSLIEKFPQFGFGYFWKATAVGKAKDPKNENFAAKTYYDKFIGSNPDPKVYKTQLMQSYKYLANYHAFNKNTDEMKVNLNKVLELDPNDQYALQGLNPPKAAPAAPKTPAKPATKTTKK